MVENSYCIRQHQGLKKKGLNDYSKDYFFRQNFFIKNDFFGCHKISSLK